MKRKSKITKRELAAVLRESVFAPNKPGPLKIIVDVGDSRYYSQRALELIVLSLQSPTGEQKQDYLGDAITLLGVAKHTIRTNCDPKVPGVWDAKVLAAMKDGDLQRDMKVVDEESLEDGRAQKIGGISRREAFYGR